MNDESIALLHARVGALGRALAILTGSLHQIGLIDGNGIAASLRLDETGVPDADAFSHEIADLIRRIVDRVDHIEPARLKAIDG